MTYIVDSVLELREAVAHVVKVLQDADGVQARRFRDLQSAMSERKKRRRRTEHVKAHVPAPARVRKTWGEVTIRDALPLPPLFTPSFTLHITLATLLVYCS